MPHGAAPCRTARLLPVLLVLLAQRSLRASAQYASCDWSAFAAQLEAVTDTCCFSAQGPSTAQPPLGNSERIRQEAHAQWMSALPSFTLPGSDPAGEGSYCEVHGGDGCAEWYTLAPLHGPGAAAYGAPAHSRCRIGLADSLSVMMSLDNCTQLLAGEPNGECAHLYSACTRCAAGCEQAVVQEILSDCDEYFHQKATRRPGDRFDVFQRLCPGVLDASCQGQCQAEFVDYLETGAQPSEGGALETWMQLPSSARAGAALEDCFREHATALSPLEQLRISTTSRYSFDQSPIDCEPAPPPACADTNPNCASGVAAGFYDCDADMCAECHWAHTCDDTCGLCSDSAETQIAQCTGLSCDEECASNLVPLLDSCGAVINALFDARDGTEDGVANKFAALERACPHENPISISTLDAIRSASDLRDAGECSDDDYRGVATTYAPPAVCVDVRPNCASGVAGGFFSCSTDMCPECGMAHQCDATCGVCIPTVGPPPPPPTPPARPPDNAPCDMGTIGDMVQRVNSACPDLVASDCEDDPAWVYIIDPGLYSEGAVSCSEYGQYFGSAYGPYHGCAYDVGTDGRLAAEACPSACGRCGVSVRPGDADCDVDVSDRTACDAVDGCVFMEASPTQYRNLCYPEDRFDNSAIMGVPGSCDLACASVFVDFFGRCFHELSAAMDQAALAPMQRLYDTCVSLPAEPVAETLERCARHTTKPKLSMEACTEFALHGTIDGATPDTPPQLCKSGGEGHDSFCVDVEANMLSVVAQLASDRSLQWAQPWLQTCEPGGVYESCRAVYDEIQNTPLIQYYYDWGRPTTWPVTGCGDSGDEDCLLAPNLNWYAAVMPEYGTWDAADTTGVLIEHGNKYKLKCASTENDQPCRVAQSTGPLAWADCSWGYTAETCSAADGCLFTDLSRDPLMVNTCENMPGPLETTTDAGTGWSDIIANYTAQREPAFREQLVRCEAALVRHTAITEVGSCRGRGYDIPVSDTGTYMADCDYCNEKPDFSFTSGLGSKYCLNYFVGLMDDLGPASCREQLRGAVGWHHHTWMDAQAHVAWLVSTAFDVTHGGYAETGQETAFCDVTPSSSSDAGIDQAPSPSPGGGH